MRWILTMTAFTIGASSADAAEPVAKEFKADGETLPYWLLAPEGAEVGKKYPLKYNPS